MCRPRSSAACTMLSKDTLDTPAIQARLREIGAGVVAPDRRSPEYLAKFVVSEIEKWAGPIKASGISVDR